MTDMLRPGLGIDRRPGGAAKAVSYAEQAGQRAIALLAYEEPSRLLRMASPPLAPAKHPKRTGHGVGCSRRAMRCP